MTRVTRGVTTRARHRKVLKAVRGQYGRRRTSFRVAKQANEKAMQYAYRDRRTRKRDMRSLWIQRINAACRLHGFKYGALIHGLKIANIEIDRKQLADLAVLQPEAFEELAKSATSKNGI